MSFRSIPRFLRKHTMRAQWSEHCSPGAQEGGERGGGEKLLGGHLKKSVEAVCQVDLQAMSAGLGLHSVWKQHFSVGKPPSLAPVQLMPCIRGDRLANILLPRS